MSVLKSTAESWFEKQLHKDESYHVAIDNRDIEMVSKVFNKGIDINQINEAGDTPLLHALKFKQEKIALLLLHLGASPILCNKEDASCTPISVACKNNLSEVHHLLQRMIKSVASGLSPSPYAPHTSTSSNVEAETDSLHSSHHDHAGHNIVPKIADDDHAHRHTGHSAYNMHLHAAVTAATLGIADRHSKQAGTTRSHSRSIDGSHGGSRGASPHRRLSVESGPTNSGKVPDELDINKVHGSKHATSQSGEGSTSRLSFFQPAGSTPITEPASTTSAVDCGVSAVITHCQVM